MKVFTWCAISDDLLPQRQAMAFWYRTWKDAGYDPFIVTPAMRPTVDVTKLVEASGQPADHWLRWLAPKLEGHFDCCLIADPSILPIIPCANFANLNSKGHLGFNTRKNPFVRFDAAGRILYSQRNTVALLDTFRRRDFTAGTPAPLFTDWQLLLEQVPDAPTHDSTRDFGLAMDASAWFVAHTPEQLLARRAERLAA